MEDPSVLPAKQTRQEKEAVSESRMRSAAGRIEECDQQGAHECAWSACRRRSVEIFNQSLLVMAAAVVFVGEHCRVLHLGRLSALEETESVRTQRTRRRRTFDRTVSAASVAAERPGDSDMPSVAVSLALHEQVSRGIVRPRMQERRVASAIGAIWRWFRRVSDLVYR